MIVAALVLFAACASVILVSWLRKKRKTDKETIGELPIDDDYEPWPASPFMSVPPRLNSQDYAPFGRSGYYTGGGAYGDKEMAQAVAAAAIARPSAEQSGGLYLSHPYEDHHQYTQDGNGAYYGYGTNDEEYYGYDFRPSQDSAAGIATVSGADQLYQQQQFQQEQQQYQGYHPGYSNGGGVIGHAPQEDTSTSNATTTYPEDDHHAQAQALQQQQTTFAQHRIFHAYEPLIYYPQPPQAPHAPQSPILASTSSPNSPPLSPKSLRRRQGDRVMEGRPSLETYADGYGFGHGGAAAAAGEGTFSPTRVESRDDTLTNTESVIMSEPALSESTSTAGLLSANPGTGGSTSTSAATSATYKTAAGMGMSAMVEGVERRKSSTLERNAKIEMNRKSPQTLVSPRLNEEDEFVEVRPAATVPAAAEDEYHHEDEDPADQRRLGRGLHANSSVSVITTATGTTEDARAFLTQLRVEESPLA